jgi:cytochrome P450
MTDDTKQGCPAAEDGGYDPFEEFNRAQGIGTVANPYDRFKEQRSRCPVHKIDPTELAGGQGRQTLPGLTELYAVISHDGVAQVLRDGETFTSTVYKNSMGLVMGHTILEMDEPEHSRYRRLIQQAFSKKALAHWETDLVRPIVNQRIDAFFERGRADLVRELTFPFPVYVIAGMLGLPAADLPEFHRRAVELISIGIDPMRGIQASAALERYFLPLIAERRDAPRDDLISVLATAELEGTRLTDAEIVAFLRLLLPAGAETTYRSSSNLLFGLLTHTEQLDAVRRDRSLLPQAIEEGLRWEPPLIGILRGVTRDTEIDGVPVPAGATLSVSMGAANRDDERYEDPDRFDIFRPQRQHLAFGFGAHRCLGMHLARVETTVALEALFDRCPNLRMDPAAQDVHITGLIFRSPTALPVLFDPS